MKLKPWQIITWAGAMTLGGISFAAAAPASRPAPAASAPAENFPTLTCADFMRAAKMAVPPKNASAAQRHTAESAQDAISAAMVWMHGYLSGRNTPNLGSISKEWLQENTAKLAKECQASQEPAKLLLVDVIARS